jgi:hypothetical protein
LITLSVLLILLCLLASIMLKRKKGKDLESNNSEVRSHWLKELSSIISGTPAKKRAKIFNELVDVPALLASVVRCVELCDENAPIEELRKTVLDMRNACTKSVPHMTFRDFMTDDVALAANRLGYKMELRDLAPMQVQASSELLVHLQKVSENVIMDIYSLPYIFMLLLLTLEQVESARELLIYPIMVEAVSEVPDVFIRVQPELTAKLKVNGVQTEVSDNPDMTAGTLKLEGKPSKAALLDFIKHGRARIREHFCLGEWKRFGDFEDGHGQLFAQEAAAWSNSGSKIPVVVNGVLTDGDRYTFNTLEGDTFYVSRTFQRSTDLPEILAYLRAAMTGKPIPAAEKVSSPAVSSSASSSSSAVPSLSSSAAPSSSSAAPSSSLDVRYPASPPDTSTFDASPVALDYGKRTSKRKKANGSQAPVRQSQRIKNDFETKRLKNN